MIRRGVEEGRKTFANTLKYILTTTSANLGNMISMAVASLVLPFLPLLAGQILLNNFLSDIPAIGLAGDSVDAELVDRPRRWNMRFIGRFMIDFGAISSAFDFLTFGVLLVVFHAAAPLFRTGWFVESLLTELLVALVVRTQRPFFRSRPGRLLLVVDGRGRRVACAIPYLPGVSSSDLSLPPGADGGDCQHRSALRDRHRTGQEALLSRGGLIRSVRCSSRKSCGTSRLATLVLRPQDTASAPRPERERYRICSSLEGNPIARASVDPQGDHDGEEQPERGQPPARTGECPAGSPAGRKASVKRVGKDLVRALARAGSVSDHSPAVARKGPTIPDQTVCEGCGSVFARKTWRRSARRRQVAAAHGGVRGTCPACRHCRRPCLRARPARGLVRGGARGRIDAAHPQRRGPGRVHAAGAPLVDVVTRGSTLEVSTTSQKLAHRLARELAKAFHGTVAYHWSDRDGRLLAVWRRDD